MHQSTVSAAVLLALAPSALAAGTAHVINNCGFPIYYASVAQSAHASMQELQGSYSESYSKPNVGVSIKLSPSMNGPVSQFEFTWADGKIFYDLSNIDGTPFADAGMSLVPSMMGDSNNPSCQEVDCPAGQSVCSAAYNNPDDVRTTVCSDQSDLTLTMCPNGGGSQSRATESNTEAAAAAAAAAASPSVASPAAASPSPVSQPSPSPAAAVPVYESSSDSGNTVRHLVAPAFAGGRFHPRHLPKK